MAKKKQPKPIRYTRYFGEAVAAHILYGIFKILPIDVASNFGGWVGRKVGLRLGVTRRALNNLEKAMPELSKEEREKIAVDMWDNLGRVLGEYPHLGKIWSLGEGGRIEVVNPEIFFKIKESKKPTIFISAHMANWELVAVGAKQNGLDLGLVYREPNNMFVRKLLKHVRSPASSILIPKGKDGAKQTIKLMKNKGLLGMLIDQKMNNGIAVPFFGRDAMTAPAVAQLAMRYDADIYPCRVERLKGANFRVTLLPHLELPDSGDKRADILAVMVEINDMLESWIRERPAQWLWVHNRWPKADVGSQKREVRN